MEMSIQSKYSDENQDRRKLSWWPRMPHRLASCRQRTRPLRTNTPRRRCRRSSRLLETHCTKRRTSARKSQPRRPQCNWSHRPRIARPTRPSPAGHPHRLGAAAGGRVPGPRRTRFPREVLMLRKANSPKQVRQRNSPRAQQWSQTAPARFLRLPGQRVKRNRSSRLSGEG